MDALDWIPENIKRICDKGHEVVIKKCTGGYIVLDKPSKELMRVEK